MSYDPGASPTSDDDRQMHMDHSHLALISEDDRLTGTLSLGCRPVPPVRRLDRCAVHGQPGMPG